MWADWIDRQQTVEDDLHPAPAAALTATLGLTTSLVSASEGELPFPWTWLYFLELAAKGDLGPDGHPKRGGFLPPVPQPRRMWAGSRCTFHAPILSGHPARKTSTIQSIAEKTGRAGPMVFVTVVHEIESEGALAMREEQDIVYMDIPNTFSPPEPQPVPECQHSELVEIDPVLLFRFSALTFNSHRIHYDRPYAMDIEKYPGLIVHGPLQAILLYEFGTRMCPDRAPAGFKFRGLRPLLDLDEVTLHARETGDGALELFTANGEGAISTKATMEWMP